MNTPNAMASITFKLPESLKSGLAKAAQADGRTLSDYIRRYFEQKFQVAKSTKKPTRK